MKTGIAMAVVVMAVAAGSLAAQQADVRSFVRQVYFEGVSYEEATKLDVASAVPILLEMLADPKEEEYWPNVVITLGMLGDERAVAPLIRFMAQAGPEQRLSRSHFVAKTGVPMALGYLVNKSGSRAALAYLNDSVKPGIWRERKLTWASPHHANDDDRDLQMSKMAILGLALSAHPSAAETLRSVQKPSAAATVDRRLATRFKDVIDEALSAHQTISKEGLVNYDRRSRRGK